MKKSFKLFLAAAFLVTEFFVIALPMLTTSARADGAIQAITHAGFGGGTDVTTRMMLLRARRVLKQDMQLVNKKGGGGAVSMDYMMSLPADGQHPNFKLISINLRCGFIKYSTERLSTSSSEYHQQIFIWHIGQFNR